MQLRVENLSFIYPYSDIKAINGMNLKLDESGLIGLFGPSGAGKTTLFQLLKGLIFPNEGQIIIDEQKYLDAKKIDRQIQKEIGLVFQFPENQFFASTVNEEISFILRQNKVKDKEIETRVAGIMEALGLPYKEFKDRSPFTLSGGEMRRVALASVLVSSPRLLLLDQPFTGLDGRGREELLEILDKISGNQVEMIIIISHQSDFMVDICNKVILMDNGITVSVGDFESIMNSFEKITSLELKYPWLYQIRDCLERKGININDDELNWDTIRRHLSMVGDN